jgi:hypothetical protein
MVNREESSFDELSLNMGVTSRWLGSFIESTFQAVLVEE